MNQLIAYLRENVLLDFQGELTMEMLRGFLKDDDSRDAKALLSKLVAERGVNDMMLVLADCLLEKVQEALDDETMRAQLRVYSES